MYAPRRRRWNEPPNVRSVGAFLASESVAGPAHAQATLRHSSASHDTVSVFGLEVSHGVLAGEAVAIQLADYKPDTGEIRIWQMELRAQSLRVARLGASPLRMVRN